MPKSGLGQLTRGQLGLIPVRSLAVALGADICAPFCLLGTARSQRLTSKSRPACCKHPARKPTTRTAPLHQAPFDYYHTHASRACYRNATYYHGRTGRAWKAQSRRAALASAGNRASC